MVLNCRKFAALKIYVRSFLLCLLDWVCDGWALLSASKAMGCNQLLSFYRLSWPTVTMCGVDTLLRVIRQSCGSVARAPTRASSSTARGGMSCSTRGRNLSCAVFVGSFSDSRRIWNHILSLMKWWTRYSFFPVAYDERLPCYLGQEFTEDVIFICA